MLLKFTKKKVQAGNSTVSQVKAATPLRMILPVIVLSLCWIISYFIWNTENKSRENELRTYFEYRAKDVIGRIQQRMTSYEQILKNVRGLFNATTSVNRTQFRLFFQSLSLDKNYLGIQGVGFSVIIPAGEVNKHITSIRNEGFPEYRVWPEGIRKIYTSIIYLEPFKDLNLRAFGYDMFSEPVRRKAMESARDLNEAIISGKVRLVQETEKEVQTGFLIYLPIYRNEKPQSNLSDRRLNIIGWVYSPFRMNNFIKGLFSEHASDLDVEIYDSKNISDETKMYDSGFLAANMDQPLILRKEIDFTGHEWTVIIKPTPQIESRLGFNPARAILMFGFSSGLLLALITWLLVNKWIHKIITGSERLRMAEELKESEEHFRSVAETAHEAIITTDSKGMILSWNLGAEKIFGYNEEEVAGKNMDLLMPQGYLDQHMNGMRFIEREGGHILAGDTAELNGLHKSGNEFPLELSLAEWKTNRGKFFTGIIRDITERKQAEEKIKKSNEQLLILNAEKDKFFSIIAHDLKSPFSGFLNLTELMADSKEKFSQEEFIECSKSLNESARNLFKLLDNLLEWTQVHKGSINFTPTDSHLYTLVSQSINTIKQRAIQKKITIINEVDKVQTVFADEKMLSTILRNLISNAVKFTRIGGQVAVKSALYDKDTVKISVEDNGVGIPARDINRLFKIEEKVSSIGTDGEQSSGLGLLLCKEFAEKNGGKIWAESQENVGSTFFFTLPIVNKMQDVMPD